MTLQIVSATIHEIIKRKIKIRQLAQIRRKLKENTSIKTRRRSERSIKNESKGIQKDETVQNKNVFRSEKCSRNLKDY